MRWAVTTVPASSRSCTTAGSAPYGACALVLSILLRWAALASIARPGAVVLALIAAHTAARATLPAVMAAVPPARSDGLAASFGAPPREVAAVAALIGALALVLCLGFGPGLVAAVLLGVAALRWRG